MWECGSDAPIRVNGLSGGSLGVEGSAAGSVDGRGERSGDTGGLGNECLWLGDGGFIFDRGQAA